MQPLLFVADIRPAAVASKLLSENEIAHHFGTCLQLPDDLLLQAGSNCNACTVAPKIVIVPSRRPQQHRDEHSNKPARLTRISEGCNNLLHSSSALYSCMPNLQSHSHTLTRSTQVRLACGVHSRPTAAQQGGRQARLVEAKPTQAHTNKGYIRTALQVSSMEKTLIASSVHFDVSPFSVHVTRSICKTQLLEYCRY